MTGSSNLLVCNDITYWGNPGTMTMSYGGQSMTRVGSQQYDSSIAGQPTYMDTFSLQGAPTGLNSLVITTQNSVTGFYAHCASYTGVDQASPIESNTQHMVGYSTCTNDSLSLATQNDNAWIVGLWGDDAGRSHTASAGTVRTDDSQGVIIDLGPKTPIGTTTVTSVPNAGTGCIATGVTLKPNTNLITATALQVEGLTNPSNISKPSPSFSAIYTHASGTPLATSYEIQVSNSSSFASTYWASGKQTLSSSTPTGQRTPLIYATTTFQTDGLTYYWRIRFWDQNNVQGAWSSSGDYFIMQVAGDYMAKVDDGSFVRYTYGTDGSWTAYDKRGWKYTFGATNNARIFDSTASSSIYRWYLERVTDPNGNGIIYNYTKDGGQVYPNYIDYTDHQGGSLYEVAFTKDFCDKNGSPCAPFATSSMYGFPVFTRYLISDITVSNAALGAGVIRRYTPTYSTGDNQSRVLLASIKDTGYADGSGGFGASTLSLPVTKFQYQTSTSTWTEVTDPNSYQVNFDITNTANDDKGYRLFDVNGDGLPDWVQSDGTTKAIRFNTGKAWGTASSTWSTPLSFSVTNAEQGVRTADVNGDGLIDLVSASSSKIVYLNNGTSGWNASTTMSFPESFIDGSNNDLGVQLVDVNGDGIADVFRSSYSSGTGTTSKVYIGNGYGWTQDLGWTIPEVLINNSKDSAVRLYDYNGDGLVDIIFSPFPPSGAGGEPTRVYYNTGHGWQKDPSVIVPFAFAEPAATLSSADRGVRFADFNSDGCVDMAQGLTSLTKDIRFSNCGTGWNNSVTGTLPEYFRDSASDYGVRMEDVNGDGLPDMVRGFFDSGSSVHTQKVYLKNGNFPDLLKQVDNSKGGKTTVSYQSSTRYLDQNGNLANPNLPLVVQTAKTITTDSGTFVGTQRVIATTTYEYQRGYYYSTSSDLLNRQFTGFGLVMESKPNAATTKTYFHQGNSSDSSNGEYNDNIAKAGRPYRVETLDGTSTSANLYSRTISKWARADYGDGRNFVKLVNVLNQVFDGDSTHRDTAASSTYDDLTGNVSVQESLGEVIGNSDGTWSDTGNDNATTTYSYAASSTLPAMSLPSRELVVDQSGTTVKDSKFYYDNLPITGLSNGNQTKIESLISGSSYASTTRTYDSYGNVATATDALGNATAFGYDGYNFLPITITNALSQQKLVSYDYSSGKAATTTDANNQTVVTVFDVLDRPILEKIPDFTTPSTFVTKSAYLYTDATTTVSSVKKTSYLSSATSTDNFVFTDGFGRTMQTKSEAEAGNGWMTKDTFYNQIGSVASDTVPYFTSASTWGAPTTTPSLFTNYYYDVMGRVATVTDTIGTSLSRYNDWQVTSVDALGNKKDAYKDAYGNLSQVIEYLTTSSSATSTYTWNRLGKMTKLTDALGNVRNFTYDLLGRLTKSEDLHTPADSTYGSSTRNYDVAGNVTTVVTPNNQTVNYTYDKLNRQLTEDFTGGSGTEIVYTYDTCTNGVGRLCKVIKQGDATTTYLYNPIGLTTTEAKQIGTVWGTTTTSYLRNGATNIAIYPDLSQVGYIYDDAGLLETVLDKEPSVATTSIILSLGYTPAGQTSVIKYANGVTATSTYDQTKKYRLSGKTAGKGTSTLQNLSYVYDLVGNITQVSDIASSSARKTVNYAYDNLYRLLTASTTAVATGTSPYAQTFAYDVLGNITSGPSGSYTYAGTGYANPDAATSIGGVTYAYDQAGNLTSYGSTTLSWDYHNYMTGSSVGSSTVKNITATNTPLLLQSKLNSVQGSTTNSVTLPNSVTSGNLIVVAISVNNQTVGTSAISDNKGNTYTKAAESIQGLDHIAIFYAKNAIGGAGFKVTSNIGDNTLSAHEYSGISTFAPIGKTSTAIGTSTTPTSGSVTVATSSSLIFSAGWSRNPDELWGPGAGYTKREEQTNDNEYERMATEDKILTATGSVSSSFSIPTSAKWAIALVTFNPSTTTAPIIYATSTPTFVQGKIEATTSSITLASSVTTGNLIVVGLTTCCNGNIPTNSITDNKGNTYTYITQVQNGVDYGALFYAKNVTGGSSFTVTSSFGGTISVNEYSGVDKTNPLDIYASGTGTSTFLITATATPSQGGELVVGLGFSMQDLDTWMPGVGYSLRESEIHNATVERHALEDRVIPFATGTTASFSVPTVEGWLVTMATFKPLVTSTSSVASSSVSQTYKYDEGGRRVLMIDPNSTTTSYWGALYQQTNGGYKKTKNIFLGGAVIATLEKTGTATATAYYNLIDPLNSASIVTDSTGVAKQTLDYLPYGDVRVNVKSTSYDSNRKYLSQINDSTLNLDYLQARYFQAPSGKFVSQDPMLKGVPPIQALLNPQLMNFYSYAVNNPINRSDPSGLWTVLGAIQSTMTSLASAIIDTTVSVATMAYNSVFHPIDSAVSVVKTVATIVTNPQIIQQAATAKVTQIVNAAKEFSTASDARQDQIIGNVMSTAIMTIAPVSVAKAIKAADAVGGLASVDRTYTSMVANVVVNDTKVGTLTGTVNVAPTLERIDAGVLLPQYRNDGIVWVNNLVKLPLQPIGYYHEYVVPTVGNPGPGAQRIVAGMAGERYYTPDHYESFIDLNPE